MQRDAVYLADILSAAADLREFTRAASLEEFCSNKTLRYAMLHTLTVIGEASSKVSAEQKGTARRGSVAGSAPPAYATGSCTITPASTTNSCGRL
jgi:hypothetical protein